MNQPIPEVTEKDVIRIVQRDFPAEQFDIVVLPNYELTVLN